MTFSKQTPNSAPAVPVATPAGATHQALKTGSWSSKLLLSCATIPAIAGLISWRALGELSQQVGLASEELFRGDRLPNLPLTPPANPHTEASD
jgi:hypothetical protein